MSQNKEVFEVSKVGANSSIAKIALNGYAIDSAASFGHVGSMRSFSIVQGQSVLMDHWISQQPLHLRNAKGEGRSVRIFAAPAQADGTGFVEFL